MSGLRDSFTDKTTQTIPSAHLCSTVHRALVYVSGHGCVLREQHGELAVVSCLLLGLMAFGLPQLSALQLAQIAPSFVTLCGPTWIPLLFEFAVPVSPISWLGPLPLSELTGK